MNIPPWTPWPPRALNLLGDEGAPPLGSHGVLESTEWFYEKILNDYSSVDPVASARIKPDRRRRRPIP